MSLVSPVLFVVGLLAAATLSVGFDQVGRVAAYSKSSEFAPKGSSVLKVRAPQVFSDQDRLAAKIAWAYFEKNRRAGSGLVDSVEGFPSTTLWDQGSYLLALIAAHRLNVVGDEEFHIRANSLLDALHNMTLYDGSLPNKAYNTIDLSMTNYANTSTAEGIGWSALDIARLLSSFHVLRLHYPEFGRRISDLLSNWELNALSGAGELIGAHRESGYTEFVQEGRIGYEQYGARAAVVWGLDMSQAISSDRILAWRQIGSVKVPIDIRRASSFGAITPTLSEPYILLGLEYGMDGEYLSLASQVYRAQEDRYSRTGVLTMVSEDHVDADASFLYSSVFSNGQDWAVVSEDGTFHPTLRTVSTKAVFGWKAMIKAEYLDLLLDYVWDLGNVERGWAAGKYEIDGRPNSVYTLNTNAVILEALHFQVFGPLGRI